MINKIVKLIVTTSAVLCTPGFCITSAHAWQSDNGNGTFTNPPLYADYPDPDIIRVGTNFYFATTTFVNTPGLTILHSQDLVHWEIVSHVVSQLDGSPNYNITNGVANYRNGVFAPSLRYYNGTFYIAVTPNGQTTRIYYSTNITGPWQSHQLNVGAFDPGLYIETNGTGYIATAGGWQNNTTFLTLNSDFSQVVASTTITNNLNLEGSKVIKRGNYYYIFNAQPGTASLYVSRATNLFGPYTFMKVFDDSTGGHQGALVDLPDGTDYGFVMKDGGAIGRVTYLCPILWSNSWPVWGTSNAPGQVPATAPMPIVGKPAYSIPTSDDFSSPTLNQQWQWNHNSDTNRWSLTARPGFLRLQPAQATNFWFARNTLTQKGQGPWSRGQVKLDLSNLQPGDICGFGTLGKNNGQIAVTADGGGNKFLSMKVIVNNGATETVDTRVALLAITGTNLFLRTDMDFNLNKGTCSYSLDGINWTTLGGQFDLAFDWATGTFQGEQFAIFCYNPNPSTGYVDVDSFSFTDNVARGRPYINAAKTTFIGDNGQLLRGPFFSTEYGAYPQSSQVQAIKSLGCNAIHLYAEDFSQGYAPGTRSNQVDQVVAMTRTNGLYLIITIGNGGMNGSFSNYYVTNFWKFYAGRYANETHVLYEIQNEPFAWGPPYSANTLAMETNAYNLIRSLTPNTPILLFTFGVLSDGPTAVADVQKLGSAINWSNAAVAVHGYAGQVQTAAAVQYIINAGYPCFMTEFYSFP